MTGQRPAKHDDRRLLSIIMLHDIIASFTFLTRPGAGRHPEVDPREMAVHFPLAGYAAGAVFIAAEVAGFLLMKDAVVATVGALALHYLLFGVFPLSGYLAAMGGFSSCGPAPDRNTFRGSWALVFGVLSLALKLYLLVRIMTSFRIYYLLPVFVVARWGASFVCAVGRQPGGDDPAFGVAGAGVHHLLLSCLYAAALFLLFPAHLVAGLLLLTALADLLVIRRANAALGGITADALGMTLEINELLLLLALSRMLVLIP